MLSIQTFTQSVESVFFGWIPVSQILSYVVLMFPDNREASQGPKVIVGLTGAPQRPPLLPSVAVASE